MRLSLLFFILASALCALSPTIEVFLAGRVLQGACNAFTTPLLLAGLGDHTPGKRLGRALGLFAAMQAAGQSFSPLITGLAQSLKGEQPGDRASDIAHLLLDQARIIEGEPPLDPTAFAQRLSRILQAGLSG